MQPLSPLPPPSEAALQHSRRLTGMIRGEIAAAGGWISFERYMRLALYAPGLGYYSGGAAKFGQEGDFVTAPEISPLFGRAVARQAAQVLEAGRSGNILEFGAGTGKLALDLLLELEKLGSPPDRYFILEVSAELRQRQQNLFERSAPRLLPRISWLTQLPARFDGLILANEVIDAMPVHLVAWRGPDLFECGVVIKDDEFKWSERPLIKGAEKEGEELFEAACGLNPQINPGTENAGAGEYSGEYISEISLSARHFMHSLGNMLENGLILLIDYGFGRSEYYHPQRNRGTLMCHYRHRAHDNPFYLPGLQDVTSHVDFTAIGEAAASSGLELMGYTTQAHFLINCGITEILAQTPAENIKDYLPLANQLQKLVSPAEMGELFKVMAFGRNIGAPLTGFTRGDRSRTL
ncbi:MAG: SAM-dependent methyltransferase [Betaproteobacteria bacterium]|nr:SAM-dependent methyltransferase [Betaproteobacteria bacterium]